MESILCGPDEVPKDVVVTTGYYFSARMAELQNIADRVANVEANAKKSQSFETILQSDYSLLKRYKTILEKATTQEKAEISQKPAKTIEKIAGLPKRPVVKKDYKKETKAQLPAAPKQLSKSSSRKQIKRGKPETISDNSISIPGQNLKKTNYNPNLLSLIFHQFTDLVLLQWEEAADLLIDEILMDEIFFLNSLESSPPSSPSLDPLPDLPDLISELSRIQNYQDSMRAKYLSK